MFQIHLQQLTTIKPTTTTSTTITTSTTKTTKTTTSTTPTTLTITATYVKIYKKMLDAIKVKNSRVK